MTAVDGRTFQHSHVQGDLKSCGVNEWTVYPRKPLSSVELGLCPSHELR